VPRPVRPSPDVLLDFLNCRRHDASFRTGCVILLQAAVLRGDDLRRAPLHQEQRAATDQGADGSAAGLHRLQEALGSSICGASSYDVPGCVIVRE
jgi:hypothetical protein